MNKIILLVAVLCGVVACSSVKPPINTPSTSIIGSSQSKAGELLNQAIVLYDKKDFQAALNAFRQADEAGHFKAKRYLGLMYLNGLGVGKNENRAFDYFKQASENGDITSQYWLAYCYENGIGTKSDLNQAIVWYQKSAQRGDKISQPAIEALKRLNINH